MNRCQIKSDNAVQSIIINSLEKSNQEYLRGCKTVYSMIDWLKNRFYQSGQTLLNILEYKIINLKLINNDYIQYINELNDLFEQHKFESNKQKKKPFDEETKLSFAINELDRIGINSQPIYSYKTFDDFIKELNKRHDFFEKAEIRTMINLIMNNNNFFENNNENEDEVYIDFTGSISVIQNCNYTTINNNNNSTHWIIDSGTGINLTNNINNSNNINKVNNKKYHLSKWWFRQGRKCRYLQW